MEEGEALDRVGDRPLRQAGADVLVELEAERSRAGKLDRAADPERQLGRGEERFAPVGLVALGQRGLFERRERSLDLLHPAAAGEAGGEMPRDLPIALVMCQDEPLFGNMLHRALPTIGARSRRSLETARKTQFLAAPRRTPRVLEICAIVRPSK